MLEHPGGGYTYDGQSRTYPDAKLICWSGGNPFHHHQDLSRLDRLWRKPESVVVMDHSWTATARRADIVLPATSPLERNDLMINRRDTALIYMSAVKAPEGEARNDYDILSALAKRMGTHADFTQGRSAQDWQRYIWSGCQKRANKDGYVLPDFDDLRTQGRFDVPDTDETRILFEDFIADPNANPLKTRSGKIEIFSPEIEVMTIPDCPPFPQWIPPVVWLGDAKPHQLHLISGQPDTRLHGQNDSGSVSLDSKIHGREPCCLHPLTARKYGLSEGDIALIQNDQGACLVGVTLSELIRRDCLWLATGAWLDLQDIDGQTICIHGNPNVLTIDKGSTGLSQGNIAHTALVSVTKWEGALPDLNVHNQPRFVPA
jgi:biotin/methionine sulfoxide reductase